MTIKVAERPSSLLLFANWASHGVDEDQYLRRFLFRQISKYSCRVMVFGRGKMISGHIQTVGGFHHVANPNRDFSEQNVVGKPA